MIPTSICFVALFAICLVQWLFHIKPRDKRPPIPRRSSPVERAYAAMLMFLMLLLCTPPASQAQSTPQTTGSFTNTITIAGSGTATINSLPVTLRKDRGIALYISMVNGAAGTEDITYKFDVTPDGTNWSTIGGVNYAVPINGTTGVRGYTNVPPSYLNNIKAIRLGTIVNGSGDTLTVTNVTWSISN